MKIGVLGKISTRNSCQTFYIKDTLAYIHLSHLQFFKKNNFFFLMINKHGLNLVDINHYVKVRGCVSVDYDLA